jgi:UDP-N-acetylmuramate--alanine ligase
MDKFSRSFSDADELFLTDIYAAGENKIEGVDARNLYNLIKNSGKPRVRFIEKNMLKGEVLNFVQKGDLILFLGAGDITKVCDETVEEIKRKVKV